MTHHNEGEIKSVVQILLAIFISFVLLRFLAVFAVNYSFLAAIGVIIGASIMYLSFRKSNEFDLFVSITCLLAIPYSILFSFVI